MTLTLNGSVLSTGDARRTDGSPFGVANVTVGENPGAEVREFVGAGSLTVWGDLAVRNIHSHAVVLAILPAGGFITLGLLLALINHLGAVQARRRGAPPPPPVNLDCRHCTLCPNGK